MRTHLFLTLAAVLAGAEALAQSNNKVPGLAEYGAFSRFVTDRNIFDPNRQPHSSSPRTRTTRTRTRASSSAPAFTLVGTMGYEKGLFAFFSGNSAELKKSLLVSGKIAGYTVTEISHGRAVLEAADKKQKLELKVGDVMREENGGWQLAGPGEVPAGSLSSGESSAVSPRAGAENPEAENSDKSEPASAGAPSDILKRLMEKREKENQ